ncbi:MAG TPA: hypothetical protein VIM16_16410 [Mucilaginibacter sp.]|jgi:hypothetical protein
MNFTKISHNTSCNCFIDAVENTNNTFVRKVRRSENLKDSDFKTHIERDKTPQNLNDCEEVCGLNGVSIEIWNEISSKPLMDKYLLTAAISPQLKKNLCVIRFKVDCGLVKHSPNQMNFNEFHYDFFKDDNFVVEKLDLVEMIQLKVA